jgi:hypothetical protein
MSDLGVLLLLLNQSGCGGYATEHRFHPERKWRFDIAWPDKMLAVEWEGGVYQNGWHQSIARYIGDCRKYNAAVLLGWRVLRYTAADSLQDVVDGVKEALKDGRD